MQARLSAERAALRRLIALSLLLGACEGPIGPSGRAGEAGPMGPAGPTGPRGDAGRPGVTPDAGEPAPIDAGGEDFPPAPEGLIGQVIDTADRALTTGRVVLVPAARVAELAAVPLDLSLPPAVAAAATHDEPIEDVLDDVDALQSASVDELGRYRFTTLSEGAYFVVFAPAEADTEHLPSMDPDRLARPSAALRGGRLDLRVSGTPSADASYVGTSSCVTCHGRHGSFGSAHALTLRRPGVSTYFQDTSRAPHIDDALAAFRAGRTLFFYDCAEPVADEPACAVSETPPADLARVKLTLELRADGQGDYAVDVVSADGGERIRYPVLLTVGGALSYQQFVTRVDLPSGGATHFVLPLSYQQAGSDERASPRDFRWLAYRAEDWVDFATGALSEPALPRAFDRECAGCHVTGLALSGNATDGFRASAAPERDGVLDLNGDGRLEQLTVSCEACHGPGSEHIELMPRGRAIVSPGLLTPDRQNALCGTCHSRPLGHGGELAPLDALGHMPRPGLRRRAYLQAHVSRVDATEQDLFASGDSRHARQQYTDFLRSLKYRNPALLVTCSDCHAPHGDTGHPSDLAFAPEDETGCTACHGAASDIHAHALAKVEFDHVRAVDQDALSCVSCHMVKTAAGGARPLALVDRSPTVPAVEYVTGDRTSHRFGYVDRSEAAEQPVAATQACAFCHADFLPNE